MNKKFSILLLLMLPFISTAIKYASEIDWWKIG
ncbi:hypothetical protein HMPREF9318_01597 [Streptococcus urinalis FB127-CNA-2]|nr:hypothetical protein HMPREF9318_01597 [Streptococcus urinalis FB127-CNA-2]VEF33077.1 Uncharacterised protein [Streptococcus urinalis]